MGRTYYLQEEEGMITLCLWENVKFSWDKEVRVGGLH